MLSHKNLRSVVLLAAMIAGQAACSEETTGESPGTTEGSGRITPENGGRIQFGDLILEVEPGAVENEVVITISEVAPGDWPAEVAQGPPEGTPDESLSEVYDFEPPQELDVPATVTSSHSVSALCPPERPFPEMFGGYLCSEGTLHPLDEVTYTYDPNGGTLTIAGQLAELLTVGFLLLGCAEEALEYWDIIGGGDPGNGDGNRCTDEPAEDASPPAQPGGSPKLDVDTVQVTRFTDGERSGIHVSVDLFDDFPPEVEEFFSWFIGIEVHATTPFELIIQEHDGEPDQLLENLTESDFEITLGGGVYSVRFFREVPTGTEVWITTGILRDETSPFTQDMAECAVP